MGWSTDHMARHYTDPISSEDQRAAAHSDFAQVRLYAIGRDTYRTRRLPTGMWS
jgi:hypothetical protein